MRKGEKSSKILLIVPHQDDEINIAGGVLYSLKNKENVYVVYVTNGDFIFDAKYRYKEAINSLRRLGINDKNIIFLGYSDQAYDQKTYIYNSENDWESLKGYSETYGALDIPEWNYKKYNQHCKFNKNNVIRNIKEVILEILPEIIICADLDFHPDHIMTSLCFEKAMGEILNNNMEYYPEVLKTFAYENSYFGENDFYDPKNNYVKFNTDQNNNLLNNPYYNIKNGINVPILNKCYTYNLFKNVIWKAIKCHKSQVLVSHATRIINKNYMYWKRETRNLLDRAHITVSSSNEYYLHDFVIADTNYVLNGNKKSIKFNEGIWIPEKEDSKKEIDITLENDTNVELIKIYNGRINYNYIKNISLIIDGKEENIELKKEPINILKINKNAKKIQIKILDKECLNGFSEIEIIEKENNNIKLLNELNRDEYNHNGKILKIIDKAIIPLTTFITKIYRTLYIK